MDSQLNEEKIKIERGTFIEVMSNIVLQLKSDNVSSSEFMNGMTVCSEITKVDFQFAYDYLKEQLIKLAPQMDVDQYSKLAQSIYRMASYMHRFEIPNADLTPLNEVAKQQFPHCKAHEN